MALFTPITVLAAALVIFCSLGLIVLFRGISGTIKETNTIRKETLAILTGDSLPLQKKQNPENFYKKGKGLSFKLALFTIGLVLLIVMMFSTPMYIIMTNRQRETLLESLYARSGVLLEGIVSSAKAYMPMAIRFRGDRGISELTQLPSMSFTLEEANYITIIGSGMDSIHMNHVWASNDPDINLKIDTPELIPGISRLNETLTSLFERISEDINNHTLKEAREIEQNIREMDREIQAIPLSETNMFRIMDIQERINYQETRLARILSEITGDMRSYPEFSKKEINYGMDGKYIFYKPIFYRQRSDNNFFRGFVVLEVSLDIITSKLFQGQMILIETIGAVALAALVIGIIGALMLATLIVRPIRTLVHHIEIIRDTEDKSKLYGMNINISSNDEIAVLGGTINDMTQGLVKAAKAASDLSIGKEIQKKFIPLEVDNQGNKLTSGFKKTQNLNFFGYYEGAKGVSGDYFDYIDLDGRYYAVIKCDVAGTGIPAAFIMIQVATMFINYFKQWKPNDEGMRIEEVVYQINEFIETLAFKGRFAAFTLCLFDSETGLVRFCNAGDNIINFYDASEGKMRAISLPSTPAAGVLPNSMIESSGGYKVQTVQIDRGDILLLYTDGIEEAKRKFRNKAFKEITCTEGPVDTPHETHQCGQADEEMTPDRVKDIINAVMAKGIYTLHKYHNPEDFTHQAVTTEDGGDLQFDFSTCEGHVEDVIMAMVSVEKMFRCYKPANAGEEARVLVDRKVDEFLKNHFLQYRRYCSQKREFPENPAYMYYTHVMEDEQYDDLTILGIKRK